MLTEKETRVLRYLAVHSKDYPSINKIAKKCKITPNGAYKILKKLENEGVLLFKRISNIKSYYIDFRNKKSLNIMELALNPRIIKKRVQYRIEDIKPMERITDGCVLFGSYLSEKKEPNDLDVLFVFEKRKYKTYQQTLSKIKEICPIKIHDVIQTKQDLINNLEKGDKVIENILENGTVLWGHSLITEVLKCQLKKN
ncbi:MAG: hypothetical protein ISS93_02025 [Candidatus Aenigmarchaeota archaeon]|nr:hypothetical protein [Candidatus Aenigmarchaeota archaeon]